MKCIIPQIWAVNLHCKIDKTFNSEFGYSDLQKSIIQFEYCNKCTESSLCENIFLCKDQIRIINYLANHFVKLRTFVRRVYEIRQLVIWIMQIDEAVQSNVVNRYFVIHRFKHVLG